MCFTHSFWNFFVTGVQDGAIYALIALGYTLVYGVLQLINFAHSEVFMSGGIGGWVVLSTVLGTHRPHGAASVFYVMLGVVAGALSGGVIAVLLERVAYRPLRRRHAPPLAFLISAIGASYFLYNLAGKIWGRQAFAVPQLYKHDATVFTVFGAAVRMDAIVVLVAALIMLVVLDRLVAGTKLGAAIRSVAQDAETASLMGVNIDRVITATFIIGGLLGGAAGFLFGMIFNVSNTMGFVPGLKAFTAAVLGGIGNVRGAVLGGFLLGIIENLGVTCVSSSWRNSIAFLVLVLVLMFRPTGLLGERLGRSA